MPTETAAQEPCFLRSERSSAFRRFCERVYGKMLNQYGTADMEQLALLLRVLQLRPGMRVLDAGCGSGATTRYLAEVTGAGFIGVDKSEAAIARALESIPGNPDRLDFCVGDLDALDFPSGSFDAIIAIEALYFPKDLAATIGQFKALLRPEGQMGLFFTHLGAAPAGPAETKLGQALLANGLVYHARDLTESDRRFWKRAQDAADELQREFEAEGNSDLMHLSETAAVLDLIRNGGHARYLYHVRLQ